MLCGVEEHAKGKWQKKSYENGWNHNEDAALESVCTGQVYVPTLILMVKATGSGMALMLLLLYNAMFILPLVVVFAATYRGLNTQTLVEWSRRNVVTSKVLLGAFFAAMGVLIWVL